MSTPEGRLRDAVGEWLRSEGFEVLKLVGGACQRSGEPDYMAYRGGRAYAIELKAPGEKPKKLQLRRLKRLAAVDVRVFVADDLAVLQAAIRESLLGEHFAVLPPEWAGAWRTLERRYPD